MSRLRYGYGMSEGRCSAFAMHFDFVLFSIIIVKIK